MNLMLGYDTSVISNFAAHKRVYGEYKIFIFRRLYQTTISVSQKLKK